MAKLEAVEDDGRPQVVFVANQVLVDREDRELVDELAQRFAAREVPAKPLPAAPQGLGPNPGVVAEDMPLPVLLQIDQPPEISKRAADLLRASFSPTVSVTTESASRLTGLVADLAADGRQVGLNVASTATTLPLLSPTDWVPFDPLSVPAYAGRARVAAAWQLVELLRQFRSTKPTTVGVLDAGFWLDGFSPAVGQGQPGSDFGPSVMQLNLMD